jgi:putative ABC transport system permease protein
MNKLTDVYRDLVLAVRSLAKARAFTFVCVATLGIGMAPFIAVQCWMRVFRTPPPGVNTEGLVELVTTTVGPRQATDQWSYPDFVDLRDAQTGVSMAGWTRGVSEITIPDTGEVRKASPTIFVSGNYFSTMGVVLARGTGFHQSTDPVVIPTFDFWQRRLGSDPDIVGKMLTVNGVPHLVTGIAPERFEGHMALSEAALFLPLERYPGLRRGNTRLDRSKTWVHIHGRLAPGVSQAQASAAVAAVTTYLAKEYRATNEFTAGMVAPYTPIGTLEGADLGVVMALWNTLMTIPLVVVCLNVSGMVQVRSAMRERELSIRQAIGASRGRLMQHLLAEAVVLATAGGTLAVLVLVDAPSVISWWVDEPIPPHMQEALRLDLPILALCAGLCLVTSLVCGWLPALRFSIPVIMTVLKDDAGSGSSRVGRVHRVTSAMQVAVAMPLVVLTVRSLDRVLATAAADLGFAAEHLYAAPLAASEGDVSLQIRKVRDNLEKASGVDLVTVADGLPLDFRYRMTRVATQPDPGTAPRVVLAHVTRVGDNYLDTMGITLVRGRGFTIDDGAAAPMVTIISKALADKLFPESEALDQRLTFQPPGNKDGAPYTLTIVGVSENFPTSQIGTDREQLLLPLTQHPDVRRDSVLVSDDRQGTQLVMVIARAAPGEPPMKLTGALENAMREVDPEFDRGRIVVGASLRQSMVDDFRNTSAFSAISGGVVLLLAALGIYGVVGLMVSTRTREIAVRVTLGATRRRVVGMILFDVMKLVAPGVAVGLLVTAAAVHLQGGVAIGNTEPLAYLVGGAVGILTAVIASLAPARRAASVEPIVAMRAI